MATAHITILCIADEALSQEAARALARLAPAARLVNVDSAGLAALPPQGASLILWQPTGDAASCRAELAAIGAVQAGRPLIALARPEAEELAAEALDYGATDYLLATPAQLRRLPSLVLRAAEQARPARGARQPAPEAPYQMMVEHMPMVVWTLDLDGTGAAPYVSPQIEALLGYSPAEWLAEASLWERVHPDDRQPAAAASPHEPMQAELRMIHRDGSHVWVSYEQQVIAQGGQRLLLSTMRNIGQRKKVEEALRDSNERYNLATEGSSDGIWDWKIAADEAYFSPRFRELMGYAQEGYLEGMAALAAVVHPDDLDRTLAAITAHLEHCEPYQVEYRLGTVSGGYRWFLVRGQAIWDSEGRPIRMAGSLTDIHDRKIAQQELEQLNRTLEQRIAERTALLDRALHDLQASEARLRAVVSNAPIVLFSIDRDGIFTLSEGRSLTLLGLAPGEAVGQSVFALYAAYPDLIGDVRSALAGENLDSIRTIGGLVFETRYTPIYAEDVISSVIGVAVDVTARARAEEELIARSAELTQANFELAYAARLKDEFLSNMSHELRTPLTSILGRTELLIDLAFGQLNERQLQYVQTIDESGRHLLALINDILDLSKIEAGKLAIETNQIAVVDLCQACMRMVSTTALHKRLTLSLVLDPDVSVIMGDERRLKQILVNLLGNAVKFTPEGGKVGLEVRGDAAAGVLRLTVVDTGIGIAASDQQRLFQPFMQIDSSLARQYTGSGLGLALVHRLATLHGGAVSVESALGAGSSFSVTLPWVPAAPRAAISAPARAPVAYGAPHVLIADDNTENVLILQEYLGVNGYRLATARTGREFLARVRAAPPDLAILDIQMPDMDGLTALQQMRGDPTIANLPVIVLSAHAMPGDEMRALAAGANRYLSKPVALAEIARAVASLLEASR